MDFKTQEQIVKMLNFYTVDTYANDTVKVSASVDVCNKVSVSIDKVLAKNSKLLIVTFDVKNLKYISLTNQLGFFFALNFLL